MIGYYVLMCPQSILAGDLGTIGTTYPIIETDFVVMAQKKVQEKLTGNDIHRWQVQQQESVRVAADRPSPVEGLHPTIQNRHWFWDPLFVIPRDVRSANGVIVLKAGSRFNPLEKIRLKSALIFFDGDDPEQVAWAKKRNQAFKGRVTLILINGSLHETLSQFPHKHVYFDQDGLITHKLQITQIPAIVTQEGNKLEIQEVKL